MPVITRTIPLPEGRTSLVVLSVHTSLCDASQIGAWREHPEAAADASPRTWTIEVPATTPGQYLRIREHLIVDGDNAIDAHRVTVPEGGPHQLDTLPVSPR